MTIKTLYKNTEKSQRNIHNIVFTM